MDRKDEKEFWLLMRRLEYLVDKDFECTQDDMKRKFPNVCVRAKDYEDFSTLEKLVEKLIEENLYKDN